MNGIVTYELKGIDCCNKKIINRFNRNVAKNTQNGCWEWKLRPMSDGYGVLVIGGKVWVLAHRLAWVLKYGSIPEGQCVLHKCDNRICVNPEHLFLGDNLDNIEDRVNKNRTSHASRNVGELNGNSKLSNEAMNDIWLSSEPYKQIARKFGISMSNITRIKKSKRSISNAKSLLYEM